MVSTLPGGVCSNPIAVRAFDRESADDYRARCRRAVAILSPGGAADAYRYLADTNIDGTPLLRADGLTPLAITRTQVLKTSLQGEVSGWYASASGEAHLDDVTAANLDIETFGVSHAPPPAATSREYSVLMWVRASPLTVSYAGASANGVAVSLTYTARAAPGPVVSSDVVKTAIETALANAFPTFPVGGFNQTAAAGSIGVDLLELVAGRSHPKRSTRSRSH